MAKPGTTGSVSLNSPEFFKVYLPDYSSHSLCIPPAFIKSFNGYLPRNLIIRDLIGKCWHVKVEIVGRKVFITNGWKDFVNDQSLEVGDFVILSYNVDSLYDVRIFGKDGCKKEGSVANIGTILHVKQEEQTESYQTCWEPTHVCKGEHSEINIKRTEKSGGSGIHESDKLNNSPEFFKVYLPDLSSHRLRIPPAFIKKFNGNIPNEVILRDISRKSWHVEVEKVETNVFMNSGWQNFAHDHSLAFGDFLVFSYNGDSLFDVRMFGKDGCKKEELTEDGQPHTDHTRVCKQKHSETGSSRAGQYKSEGNALLNLKKRKAWISAEYIAPKKISFVASISRSSQFYQYVPTSFVKSSGIKLYPDVTLRDKNGKSWPVKIGFRKDGRICIASGWTKFWKDNKLGLGGKCMFEFILGSGRMCKEIEVQILHAGAKLERHGRDDIKPTVHKLQDRPILSPRVEYF